MGLKAGDRIHFVNKLDGKEYSLTVEGIVNTYAEQMIYMPLDSSMDDIALPMTMIIAGFYLGFPVMLAFGNTLYGYLGEMVNLVLPMVVNPFYVLLSFGLIFGVYWVSKYLCGRKAAKILMSEALKAGVE